MFDLLRLTRPLNLAIIAGTMCVIRYGVIGGLLAASDLSLQMPRMDFMLLVLSTVLIAAGGNVINDYFDTRIDRVNKPEEVIVGRSVKRRVAMATHMVLSGFGLVIGTWVAWRMDLLRLMVIPAFAVGALWMYSTSFKRRFILGNGTVAVLTALVPLTVGLYELPLLQRTYTEFLLEAFGNIESVRFYFQVIWWWVIAFSLFAFLSTLVRELQKDMADVPGDRADGCRTLPIVWGMNAARWITIAYLILIVAVLLLIRRTFLEDAMTYWYFSLLVLVLLITAGLTYAAGSRKEHVRAGTVMKLAMVLAVGYGMLVGMVLESI